MGGSGSSPRAPRDPVPAGRSGSSPGLPRVTLFPLVAQGAVLGSRPTKRRDPRTDPGAGLPPAAPAAGTPLALRLPRLQLRRLRLPRPAPAVRPVAPRASRVLCLPRPVPPAPCASRVLQPPARLRLPRLCPPCPAPAALASRVSRVVCLLCCVCLPRPALCRPRRQATSSSRPPSLPAPAPLAPVSVPHAPSPAHRASQTSLAPHPFRSSGRLMRTTSTVIASIMVRR